MCHELAVSTVVPFRPKPPPRLGWHERMVAARWALTARSQGVARVLFYDAEPDDTQFGDFVLIYEAGRDWASWGVAPDRRGFIVWRSGTGETIGWFSSMLMALDTIGANSNLPRDRRTKRTHPPGVPGCAQASLLPLR